MTPTRYDMAVFLSVEQMKSAREALGKVGDIDEAMVATGIDAFFALLEGKRVEIDGKLWIAREVTS